VRDKKEYSVSVDGDLRGKKAARKAEFRPENRRMRLYPFIQILIISLTAGHFDFLKHLLR